MESVICNLVKNLEIPIQKIGTTFGKGEGKSSKPGIGAFLNVVVFSPFWSHSYKDFGIYRSKRKNKKKTHINLHKHIYLIINIYKRKTQKHTQIPAQAHVFDYHPLR